MANFLFHLTIEFFVVTVAVRGQQSPGNVEIDSCEDGFIDIEENANNTIVCRGLNRSATVKWFKEKTGKPITPVATCGPGFACTVHQPAHFAALKTSSLSQLFYKQYNTTLDTGWNIKCERQLGSDGVSKTCTLNVIRQANLSGCSVEVDTQKGTAAGRCEFEGAFSQHRNFTCTWYLEESGQEVEEVPGNITYTKGSHGPDGLCTFSLVNVNVNHTANYTYSILFYPGPGKLRLNASNVEAKTNSKDTTDDGADNPSSEGNAVTGTTVVGAFLGVVVCVAVLIT